MQISDFTLNLRIYHPCVSTYSAMKIDKAGIYTVSEVIDIINNNTCKALAVAGPPPDPNVLQKVKNCNYCKTGYYANHTRHSRTVRTIRLEVIRGNPSAYTEPVATLAFGLQVKALSKAKDKLPATKATMTVKCYNKDYKNIKINGASLSIKGVNMTDTISDLVESSGMRQSLLEQVEFAKQKYVKEIEDIFNTYSSALNNLQGG